MPHLSPLSRRRLLEVGGLTAAALATGGALVMRGGGDEHYRSLLPGAAPLTLSTKELGVFAVFCDRVCPSAAGLHPGPRLLRIAERVDRELSFHTPKMRSDVKSALLVLEHGGLAHLSTTRFTRLSPVEQDTYLSRMAASGTELERQVFGSLKLMALFFYYCDERTWAAAHYGGPLQPRKRPEADSWLESAHG